MNQHDDRVAGHSCDPRRQRLVGIETTGGGNQALPPKHLKNSGDTATKPKGGFGDGGVHVGHRDGFGEPLRGNAAALPGCLEAIRLLDGPASPDALVPE